MKNAVYRCKTWNEIFENLTNLKIGHLFNNLQLYE